MSHHPLCYTQIGKIYVYWSAPYFVHLAKYPGILSSLTCVGLQYSLNGCLVFHYLDMLTFIHQFPLGGC